MCAWGPSIWMLVNICRYFLFATSNRSEVVVGYVMMDGDICGGISSIVGIDKVFFCIWL